MGRDDELVTLTRTETEIEASAIAQALEESGVKAVINGQFTAGFRAEAPGLVNVVVRSKDLMKARKILAAIEFSDEPVDWSQVDTGQPLE